MLEVIRSRQEADAEFADYVRTRLDGWRRLARMLCQDTDRGDDLVQQTITKLYTWWHRRHSVFHLDGYVRRMLVREFLDERRLSWTRRVTLRARLTELEAMAPAAAPAPACGVEDRLLVREALSRMPPRQRAVLVLRFLCDLPVGEVARIMRCTEGTVKSQTSQGLAAMRRLLAQETSYAQRKG